MAFIAQTRLKPRAQELRILCPVLPRSFDSRLLECQDGAGCSQWAESVQCAPHEAIVYGMHDLSPGQGKQLRELDLTTGPMPQHIG